MSRHRVIQGYGFQYLQASNVVERVNIFWSLSLCVWAVSLLFSFYFYSLERSAQKFNHNCLNLHHLESTVLSTTWSDQSEDIMLEFSKPVFYLSSKSFLSNILSILSFWNTDKSHIRPSWLILQFSYLFSFIAYFAVFLFYFLGGCLDSINKTFYFSFYISMPTNSFWISGDYFIVFK